MVRKCVLSGGVLGLNTFCRGCSSHTTLVGLLYLGGDKSKKVCTGYEVQPTKGLNLLKESECHASVQVLFSFSLCYFHYYCDCTNKYIQIQMYVPNVMELIYGMKKMHLLILYFSLFVSIIHLSLGISFEWFNNLLLLKAKFCLFLAGCSFTSLKRSTNFIQYWKFQVEKQQAYLWKSKFNI